MSFIERIADFGLDHNRLLTTTVIKGSIENKTPIRIGKPGEGLKSAADLPIERLPDGTVYIPGSSLKGSLRTLATKIALASGRRVCNIFGEHPNICELAVIILRRAYRLQYSRENEILKKIRETLRSKIKILKEREEVEPLVKLVEEVENIDELLSGMKNLDVPCIVCRVFGNTELASHILVHDAIPYSNPKIDYRTRVALDRFRSAARTGALFTYEYVPPEFTWKLQMEFHNIPLLSGKGDIVEFMRSILKYIRNMGFHIGSMKTVGLGLVKLEDIKVEEYRVRNFKLELVGEGGVEVFEKW